MAFIECLFYARHYSKTKHKLSHVTHELAIIIPILQRKMVKLCRLVDMSVKWWSQTSSGKLLQGPPVLTIILYVPKDFNGQKKRKKGLIKFMHGHIECWCSPNL